MIDLALILSAMAVICLNRNFSFTHAKIVAVYKAEFPKLNPIRELPSLRIYRTMSFIVFIALTGSFLIL